MSLRPLSSLSLFTRVDIGIFVIAATVLFTVYLRQRNRDPYPPGPKGLPIIGNILDIPEKKPWVAYRDWSRKMGRLFYLTCGRALTTLAVRLSRHPVERDGHYNHCGE